MMDRSSVVSILFISITHISSHLLNALFSKRYVPLLYYVSLRRVRITHAHTGHYNLPNPLVEYLYHSHPHVIRDLSTLSITIGPYESYYAHDKTSASWGNLPSSLEKAILSRLESQDAWKTVWKGNGSEAPSFVSLGDDGSYFMRTVGGGGSWDLKSKADGMVGTNKFLDESPNFQGIAVCSSRHHG
jgi:hypothetical protein